MFCSVLFLCFLTHISIFHIVQSKQAFSLAFACFDLFQKADSQLYGDNNNNIKRPFLQEFIALYNY